nr:hypothetical protein [Pleurocapsa sp. MO_192.B19]
RLPLSASPSQSNPNSELLNIDFEDLVSDYIFAQDDPPRWLILAGIHQIVLLDRFKWNASRLLRFDLEEILARLDNDALQAKAILLHREHTCPSEGTALLDELDENSHKHAFSVSDDLKYALRESIELLGNEAVWYKCNKLKEKRSKVKKDEEQLTLECLRYMYRLLFLFYIEARRELGYAPMNSDVYRQGYSLEFLRNLENVDLRTTEDTEGYFIDASIKKLFKLVWEGFPEQDYEQTELNLEKREITHDTFELKPLKSHLFDPARLSLLNKVKFRNVVLRRVIELMSLSRESKGKRRGRISYAQLGINQLGAVYEALLCFRGFFVEDKKGLYEVKPAKDKNTDELKVAYFVKLQDLENYTDDERVFNADGTPRCYPKDTFIYRLAGRDRQNSASYYTPESLTRCLVKYSLKELLKDKNADDILQLRICEPAMGSAAFLNEAINQLAEAYLELKQKELNQRIKQEDRRMFGASSERSLIGCILPPQVANINTTVSTAIKNNKRLATFAGLCSSVVFDFYLKSTGKTDLYGSLLATFPYFESQEIMLRALVLNCLTTHYTELWESTYIPEFNQDTWTKQDSRLKNQFFENLTSNWQRNIALRTDYERRQALVEIDVLAAMALGLTLDELITIYRVQFPVMRQYEKDTWYDQNGRIVFTSSKGLPGVGFPRKAKKGETGWEDIKDMKTGTVERTIEDNTLPGGSVTRTIVYEAPFDKCDREEDYQIAWAAFEQRFLSKK